MVERPSSEIPFVVLHARPHEPLDAMSERPGQVGEPDEFDQQARVENSPHSPEAAEVEGESGGDHLPRK